MREALKGEAPERPELARLIAQMEENTNELNALGAGPQRLEAELDRLRRILADPGQHLSVSTRELRLTQMNIVVERGEPGGKDFSFQVAQLPGNPPSTRAFALVRFPRAELMAPERLTDEAARFLA
jgi:hypothetical protein